LIESVLLNLLPIHYNLWFHHFGYISGFGMQEVCDRIHVCAL